ncbi:hypothetical protein [Acanthopleuribacter pedis]|uniref:Transmembrane protein n=1 Tax=Acanthopleuribacter pedis TaxID=442870 RepID=A0A8J7U1D1_9BACT|nr:hypothetical protein [Acanthopleuribacter pedis]MBO1318048.1 hypothetical protein [Acanthopleuribacter pedis]
MESWMLFWKVIFFIVLALFAILSVWVTIGGFRDLQYLFRKMEEEQQEAAKKQASQT